MEPISKTITRNPRDRKQRLVLTAVDRDTFLVLLAFLIIAGLETYYQNRYGDPGTTYVGGFWTFVYVVLWLIALIMRREGSKRFMAFLERHGRDVEETVRFSDHTFEATIDGYFSFHYPWTSLSSFRDSKNYLRFTLAGIEFMIPKKHFTQEEVNQIIVLLRSKMQLPNKSVQGAKSNKSVLLTYPRTDRASVINRRARLLIIVAVVGPIAICLLLIGVSILSGVTGVVVGDDERIAECNLEKSEIQVLSTDSFILVIKDCFWEGKSVNRLSFSPPYIRTTESEILVVDMIIANRLSRELQYDCELVDAEGRQFSNSPGSELFIVALLPDEAQFGNMEFRGFSNEGQKLDLYCHSAVLEDSPGLGSTRKQLDEAVLRIQ